MVKLFRYSLMRLFVRLIILDVPFGQALPYKPLAWSTSTTTVTEAQNLQRPADDGLAPRTHSLRLISTSVQVGLSMLAKLECC